MITIINFKTYPAASGKKAVVLARICDKIARAKKHAVALAVQAYDIAAVSSAVQIPVLAQHIDAMDPGAHTGWMAAASAKNAGAIGSLLNHSEHPISLSEIKKTIIKLRENKLLSIVCAPTAAMVKKIAALKPDVVAFEPPELIGGNKSVSGTKPREVKNAVKAANGIPLLCGAGIKTRADVLKAQELGVQGILISSGIVNAKSPKKVLKELLIYRK